MRLLAVEPLVVPRLEVGMPVSTKVKLEGVSMFSSRVLQVQNEVCLVN